MELWFPTELDPVEILKRRAHIKRRLLVNHEEGVTHGVESFEFGVTGLRRMVCEYNRMFFENRLFEALNHQKTALDVKIGSVRMKKGWAACCDYHWPVCNLCFHPELAELGSNHNGGNGNGNGSNGNGWDVNGIVGLDLLDCVQLILEHEMVHMLILVFLQLKEASHGRTFKALAKGLFGHPLYTHALTARNSNAEDRVRHSLDAEAKYKTYKPGTVISIASQDKDDNPSLAAVILRKQQTLTVMHPDGKLLEKVPYHLTQLFAPPDQDGDEVHGELESLEALESNYNRFLDNKKNLKQGSVVQYLRSDQRIASATVLKKKPLGALLLVNPTTTTTIPFHALIPK